MERNAVWWADLFDSPEEAMDFVMLCGGGIVFTELADNIFALASAAKRTAEGSIGEKSDTRSVSTMTWGAI